MFSAHRLIIGALLVAAMSSAAVVHAGVITLEPDDYAAGTTLSTINPAVTLFATVNATDLTSNFGFSVTSATDALASTGSRVFAHAGVSFFNSTRNFRMTFTDAVSMVGLDFIASIVNENAILRIYDAAEQLLAELVLPGAGAGVSQTLSLSRPQADIKYAVASSSGPFLRLDNMQFGNVPSPSALLLMLSGLGYVMGASIFRSGKR